jgi:DNA ligase (NAD+)
MTAALTEKLRRQDRERHGEVNTGGMRRRGIGKIRWCAAGLLLALGLRLLGAEKPVGDDAARARLAELRAEIAHHDELYFRKEAPEISDAEYDGLKRQLAALEQAHPQWALISVVGDDRNGRFPTWVHREPMLGLDKVYTEAEWRTFHAGAAARLGRKDFTLVIEPKYDGLAISLTYERGVLTRAVSRGNGVEGDDVTANARMIAMLPHQLRPAVPGGASFPELVELRGEVYIDDAEFARLNAARKAEGAVPFGHPRNLAAGTLKSLDPDFVASRRLSIVIYGWGLWKGGEVPSSQQAFHAQVRAWGLPGVGKFEVASSSAGAWREVQAFGRTRAQLGFPTDGVVIKLDDVGLRSRVGQGAAAPRWAVAYKYEPERAITRVRGITIQVGRTGLLTPVAELEPVALGRTTIARATLHNREALARQDIRVGDFVEIEKAGEVIPSIAAVLVDRRPAGTARYAFPVRCSACNAPVESKPRESAVRCPNPRCPAQRQRRLEHFASAQAVAIRGLGPATIGVLIKAGLVTTPGDFYRLQIADLQGLEGISPQAAARLLAGIERSKRAGLWRFIHGLGIPGIGSANARKLAAACGSLESLERMPRERVIEAVGPAAADAVGEFLAQPENKADLAKLRFPMKEPGSGP